MAERSLERKMTESHADKEVITNTQATITALQLKNPSFSREITRAKFVRLAL